MGITGASGGRHYLIDESEIAKKTRGWTPVGVHGNSLWKAQRRRGHAGCEGMKDFSMMEHARGCQEGAVCWERAGCR